MKLDYTLTDPQERNALVNQILSETPDPTPAYLDALADLDIDDSVDLEKFDFTL